MLLEAWMAGTTALVHAGSDVMRYQCARSHAGLWFKTYLEFEESLLLLLEQEELRKKLAANGRAFVLSEYSWDVICQRLFKALDE